MIKNPAQVKLLRTGATLYNFGGGGKSDSHTDTTNTTTNNTNYKDNRAVASDSAVSLTGDNNVVDRSSNTTFTDTSNRSTTSLTSFIDKSDRSVTNTTTDFGSVKAALDASGVMTAKAFDVSADAIKGAIDSLKLNSNNGLEMVSKAFDLSKASAANAQQSSAQLMGFATSALQATQQAVADAKDGGQSKMVIYAIAAVAAVGIAFALSKR